MLWRWSVDEVEVSVIMTVKDGAQYLESSLSSVFYQTRLPKEVVVVNDGSADNTWEILQRLRLIAPMPVRLLDTRGIGRSAALNLAVRHAQYPWLANIDADDVWLTEKLEHQAAVVRTFPDADAVVTASHIVYGNVEKGLNTHGVFSVTPLGRDSFYIRNPINHSSILFSRRFHDQVGGYNESLSRQVDIDLWIRALRIGYVFYRIDSPLTIKRLHDGQSYEVGNRFAYTSNALKMSLLNLWKLNAPFYYFPIPFAKFLYNNIPRSVRRRLIH